MPSEKFRIIIVRRLIFRAPFEITWTDSLYHRVLVLNRAFLPIHITNLKRAISLLYLGLAQGIDREYQTYQWDQLIEIDQLEDKRDCFHFLRSVRHLVAIPRVIVLKEFDRLPQRKLRFSRQHIFIRDGYTCQYCAKRYPKHKLNLDHVHPRSRGGRTIWENVVTSCHSCNRKKADRTPSEAGMPLLSHPKKPRGSLGLIAHKSVQTSWRPFLGIDSN